MLVADRVRETSTTTGTGTLSLAGAVTGRITFVSGIGTGNTCWYVIENEDVASEWEVGIGTVTDATPDTLSRTTIIASSNAGAAVNLSAGTKQVFVAAPAYLQARHVRTVTDNYTATAQDDWVIVNVATAKTITLPTAAASLNGKRIAITRIAASSITGKTTLSGVAYALYEQFASVIVECDGSTWYVIASHGQTGTGEDEEDWYEEEVTLSTTDATETNIWTVAMSDDSVYFAEYEIRAFQTSSPVGDACWFKGRIIGRRDDTGPSLDAGTGADTTVANGLAGPGIVVDATSNTLRLRVTGNSATNISWYGTVRWRRYAF